MGNNLNILAANYGFSGNIDLSPSTVKETPGILLNNLLLIFTIYPGFIEVILLNF